LPLNKAAASTLALALLLTAAACSRSPRAPDEAGTCFRMTTAPGPKAAYEAVAYRTPSFDVCAAYLEATRIKRGDKTLIGAFQGWFLNLRPEGVYMSRHLEIAPMIALVRTDDGRLAPPNAAARCVAADAAGAVVRTAGRSLELSPCVKILFAGRCPAPGETLHGRWGEVVMRSTAGRIERRDGAGWVLMTPQNPDCSLPIK
jgi:hypothetical protein